MLTRQEMDAVRTRWNDDIQEKARIAREEPLPDPSTIWKHIYAEDK